MKYTKYLSIAFLMVIIDHIIKLWVEKNMGLDSTADEIPLIGEWFRLHYTLNPGMAFGMQLPAPYGKIILSVFRLIAVVGIAWYIHSLSKKNAHWGLLTCMSLILGGALGNVIDSTFYGVLLNNAPDDAPMGWFHGQVIDMFYVRFPTTSRIPDWMPFWGGLPYSTPIFNFADASIFVGVVFILIFQRRYFLVEEENNTENIDKNIALEKSPIDKNIIENIENTISSDISDNISEVIAENTTENIANEITEIPTENLAPTSEK